MSESALLFNIESIVDWVIVGIISLSVLISLFRGFIREAISLITWATAIWVGIQYSQSISEFFPEFSTPAVRLFLSFFILFLVVVILGGIFNYALSRAIKLVGFGWFDRVVGAVFGFLRGGLVVMIGVFFLASTPMVEQSFWKTSGLLPGFQVLTERIVLLLPEDFVKKISI